jgi:hypothetical protein
VIETVYRYRALYVDSSTNFAYTKSKHQLYETFSHSTLYDATSIICCVLSGHINLLKIR